MADTARAGSCAIGAGGHPRLVIQIRAQPTFGFLQAHPLPKVVIDDLVSLQLAYAEVLGLRMGKVKAADTGARPHRAALGELDAGVSLDVEQFPQSPLLGVVGAGRVTGGRPNTTVLLAN